MQGGEHTFSIGIGENKTETLGESVIPSRNSTLVHDILWFVVYLPVIIGIPGNIVTILVANMSHNKKRCTSVYMMGLAIADTAILIQQLEQLALRYVPLEVWTPEGYMIG